MGFCSSFDLLEPFADLAILCFYFYYVVPGQSSSILPMKIGGVPVPSLQPETSGFKSPVFFLLSKGLMSGTLSFNFFFQQLCCDIFTFHGCLQGLQ
jgi:hypothetical protein